MCEIRGIRIISGIICCIFIASVSAAVNRGDFETYRYPRICDGSFNQVINYICYQIGVTRYEEQYLYNPPISIKGSCETRPVELYNPNVQDNQYLKAKVVICNLGPNLQRCATTSSTEGTYEYYEYKHISSKRGWGCVHINSIEISLASATDAGASNADTSAGGADAST